MESRETLYNFIFLNEMALQKEKIAPSSNAPKAW